MEESKQSTGNLSGRHKPLFRVSSGRSSRGTYGGFNRSVRRMLRTPSKVFRHSRSIKPAEAAASAPSPAVNPDPPDGTGVGMHANVASSSDSRAGAGGGERAGAGAGAGEGTGAGTRAGTGAEARAGTGTGAEARAGTGTGSKKTSIETRASKDAKKTKKMSRWTTAIFSPVTGLVKAYINFMMRPSPDEDGYTPGSHSMAMSTNPTIGGNMSQAPSPSLSARASGTDTPGSGSGSSRSQAAGYRPSQSGPIPSSHRHRQASGRRYPHSGPLPGGHERSHLVHSDSRRYSGELRRDGELLKRRTAQEMERDAVVGQAVVFGPGKPTPPPKEREPVVEEGEEDLVYAVPSRPSSSSAPYAPRLFAVAEEAGTPRGVSLA